MGLAGGHWHRLAVLAAHPRVEIEVGGDGVDVLQHPWAVADQGGTLDGVGDLAVLDQVALGDGEDEVAGDRVDLAAAQLLRVDAAAGVGEDILEGVLARGDESVGHARDGQVAVGLAPPVAGGRDAVAQ